jgi:Transposase DDE domain
VATGTIVDAAIINAPSSTKNAQKARDPEVRQTKKRNQWYFGMKAHLGVDSRTKLTHAVVATPADVAGSTVLPELPHGNETRVWARSSLSRPARGDSPASSEGETSSTAAIASAASWTRSSAHETAATRRCGPKSSIRSGSSSGGSALLTALSRAQKERIAALSPTRWSICSWCAAICCAGSRPRGPTRAAAHAQLGQYDPRTPLPSHPVAGCADLHHPQPPDEPLDARVLRTATVPPTSSGGHLVQHRRNKRRRLWLRGTAAAGSRLNS